jgi:hypothetical protein
MPGLVLTSCLMDCGHYAFLRDAKDTIRIGDTRLCRRCPAKTSAKKEGTHA